MTKNDPKKLPKTTPRRLQNDIFFSIDFWTNFDAKRGAGPVLFWCRPGAVLAECAPPVLIAIISNNKQLANYAVIQHAKHPQGMRRI